MTSLHRSNDADPFRGQDIRHAVDHIPGLVWTALADGHVDFLNLRWCEYTGLGLEQARGWGWQAAIHPEDLPGLVDIWKQVLSAGQPGQAEARLRRFDGVYRWFSFRAAPLLDASMRVVKWYGQTVDIDDTRQAQALLAGEKRLLEMVARGSPLKLTLRTMCHLVEQLVADSVAAIMLLDESGQRLYTAAAPSLPHSYARALDGSSIDGGAGPCGYAAYVRQPVALPDIAGDSRWSGYRALVLRLGLRALFSMPILSRSGQVLGTFAVYFHQPHQILAQEAGVMEQLNGLAAVAIERQRTDSALQRSEQRFALAVAGSNDGIWDWDIASDCIFLSERAQRLYGLEPGVTVRPRAEWRAQVSVHPDDIGRPFWPVAHDVPDGMACDVECRVRQPDAAYRWLRVRGLCLRDAAGRPTRMAGSVSDVEPQKRAEAMLLRAQRLEAAGTLAGGIAHDFNNILSVILGYGEMALRHAARGSRLRRDIESILVADERARALVDRILAFSRSSVAERAPVHVEGVVQEALELLSATLPPDVAVTARLKAGTAAMLGDSTQIHQVFMNLATNAIQAMPSGGRLEVALDLECLEQERLTNTGPLAPGSYLRLRIADTGTGIAPDVIDRIFDPFFTTKDTGAGTGLGLSLVYGIVAELGGAVEVCSQPGAGSVFTVFLPRSGEVADATGEVEASLPRGHGEHVLVVDDEAALVALMTDTLTELGYRPQGLTSSAEARAVLQARPDAFDVLITDERMPTLAGTALVREARALCPGLAIVLVSGYLGAAEPAVARQAGADEVLQKPVATRDLAQILARLLAPR